MTQQAVSQSSKRHSLHFIAFSVILFLIILVVSSVAFFLSMQQIIRSNKADELLRLLEFERHKMETEVNSDINVVLKMASSPVIQQHFLAPNDLKAAEIALKDIDGYRRMFTSASIFWVKDADKKFFLDGEDAYTVDPDDPEKYWYKMTMHETGRYNWNIDCDVDLGVTNIWINAPVFGPDGNPIGILGIGVNLSDFINAIYQSYSGTADLYFFNTKGEITGSKNVGQVAAKEHIDKIFGNGFLTMAHDLKPDETRTFNSPLGKVAVGSVPALEWYSVAVIPDSIDDYKNHVSVVFIVMLVVMALITIIFNIFIAHFLKSLHKAMNSLEATSRYKSEFLARMSHEIRTPMNAILGITEIQLQNGKLDLGIREAFERIYSSGDLLLGIINDILDLSRIEAGKLELVIDQYEIASLISDTAQLNMMRIGSKSIEFELYVNEHLPTVLLGDELRVKQILNNLLSNAFKYTAEGKVKLTISAETIDGKEDEMVLVICVSDTGQGMTKEQVSKLFDEYSRFNTEANRSTEGTGLGMNITRNLVRLMSGEISVESEPGKGSEITVRLPQGKSGSEVLGQEMADNLQLFRTNSRSQMRRVQITRELMPYGSVLIVDDVETNIYVAKGLLSAYGLKIDSASSGLAAIEKIQQGNLYDIVFMDHMMPKMDGMEATKIIRDLGYDCPIVALTANAVSGRADVFLKNGFDDFISKPIDIRQLNAILNKLIRDKQSPETLLEAGKAAQQEEQSPIPATPQPAIDPLLVQIFVHDTSKALAILEDIVEKNDYGNEENMRAYIISVHSMKSTIAVMGKMDLSAVAGRLEVAGREGTLEIIISETPVFVNALRAFIEELTPPEEDAGGEMSEEEETHLREMLLVIKTASEEYDENTVDEAIRELNKTTWSKPIRELLNKIAEYLLHSDFDEIVAVVDENVNREK